MRVPYQIRPGTVGTPGTALRDKAFRCPHWAARIGDTGDNIIERCTPVVHLSPLSPRDERQRGHGKPLWHKAVPTVPAVPTTKLRGAYAF
jgi:hypothetical protein